LKESNDAKDKLFSIISHDLRGPFNSIIMFVELLDEKYNYFSEDQKRLFSDEIKKSVQNAYDFLNNLLIWSRSQTDGIKVAPVVLDLAETVGKQIELYEISAASKLISISSKVRHGTLVFADKDMVKTILFNLISNAVKFTHPNGTITISSRIVGDEVHLTVADNGLGINSSDLEKIFKPGKIHSTPGTCKEKGTGLGLVICKEFTEKNRGKIWAESEPENGSKFTITLPGYNKSVK
jgi:signal transduction histidine kinase